MNIITEAIGLGLLVGISVGPIFFAIVQSSLKEGFKAGFAVSVGILVSDILVVLACYWGLSQLTALQDNATFKLIFGIVGGLLLLGFGLALFIKPPPSLQELRSIPKQSATLFAHFSKGFILNVFNPFGLIYWLTLMTAAVITRSFSTNHLILYFSIIILIIGITDVIKAFFAHKIRHRLLPRHLRVFGWGAGVIVMGIGLWVVVQAL